MSDILLERFLVLPRHSWQDPPSLIPNLLLGPEALYHLIRLAIDLGICSGSRTRFPGSCPALKSFALFRNLVEKLMKWSGGLILAHS